VSSVCNGQAFGPAPAAQCGVAYTDGRSTYRWNPVCWPGTPPARTPRQFRMVSPELRKSAREESSLETGIDKPGCLVHTTFSVTLFVAHQATVMLHIARRLAFALVFACHAAVTLCGPCLHALPGSSHELGATSNSQHTDDSAQSRRDGADNCLICQFVAQRQLPAEVFTATSFDQMNELVLPVAALSHPVSVPLPSFPRAPPFANFTLS